MLWLATSGWASPHIYKLWSPDRNYEFTFTQDDSDGTTRLSYTLSYKGKKIIGKSGLGVDIENKLLESALGIPNDHCKQWGDNLTFIGVDSAEAREMLGMHGQRPLVHYDYLYLD